MPQRTDALLETLGEAPLSRNGPNRCAARMEAVGRPLRERREAAEVAEIAKAWLAKLGDALADDVGRLLADGGDARTGPLRDGRRRGLGGDPGAAPMTGRYRARC